MSEESLHELTNESFDDYRQSFSCGSRTDLLFKFLKNGSIEEADQLIRQIFDQAGDLIDTGDPSELIQTITEAQKSAYAGAGHFQYDDKPFTKSAKPVSELNVGLLTTTGHFTEGDDPEPFGMKGLTQDDVVKMTSEFGKADPILSRIPIDTPAEKTLVRHGGYDIRAVERDRNVGLPIDRMRELEADGVIGKFADPAFSFVGLASQLKLRSRLCFEWAQRLKQSGAEAIVLVPI